MSDFLPPVVAVLTGSIGEFSAKMNEAKGEMASVEGTARKTGALGKMALLGIGVAAAGIAAESVKMASGFDRSMELIHTQAGASQSEVDGLKAKVLALAPTVGIGPEKLADGLYHVESAGFRGSAALSITAAAAKEAALGMADMEGVTQSLIGTMAAGLKDVHGAADATAYLNRIVGIGDMRMGKLAQAISTGVLPSFKSAGLGMADFGAGLATLTDNVTPADEAATRLRMTVSLMAAPSGPAVKALKSIGVGSTELANDLRRPDGLLFAVDDLKKHLADSGKTAAEQNQVIQHAFGGGRTSGAILTLLGETDRLKDKYKELGTASSRARDAQEAWRATQKQFSQQVHEIAAQFETWGVELGNLLIPYIQEFLADVRQGIGWLREHKEVLEALGIMVGVVLVAGLVKLTQAMVMFTGSLITNPVFLVITALALLAIGVVELIKHWDAVKRVFGEVWGWIKGQWQSLVVAPAEAALHGLQTAWAATVDFFKALWSGIVTGWQDYVVAPAMAAYHGLLAVWRPVVAFFEAMWSGVVGAFDTVWSGLVNSEPIRFVEGLIGDFTDFWHAHADEIVEVVQFAWRVISDIYKTEFKIVNTVVKAYLTALRAVWSVTWAAISAVTSFTWNIISGVVHAGMSVVSDIIKFDLRVLEIAWSVTWAAISGAARLAWDLIRNVVVTYWHVVEGVIRVGMDIVTTVLKVGWDLIAGIVVGVWDLISGYIKTVVDLILDIVGVFLDLVTGHWSRAWSDLKKVFTDFAHNVLATLTNFFGDALHWLVKAGKDLVTGLWHGIRDTFHLVTQFVHDVKHTVVTYFVDAGKWLYGVGKALVIGLWNGVRDMISWFLGKLSGFAGSIKNHLEGWLGIASPSRMTYQHGQYLVEGLAAGIQDHTGLALDAAHGLAAGVLAATSGMSVSMGGGGLPGLSLGGLRSGPPPLFAGAPSLRPIEITLHNHVMLDGRELHTSTQSRTLRQERRNFTNGLSRVAAGAR